MSLARRWKTVSILFALAITAVYLSLPRLVMLVYAEQAETRLSRIRSILEIAETMNPVERNAFTVKPRSLTDDNTAYVFLSDLSRRTEPADTDPDLQALMRTRLIARQADGAPAASGPPHARAYRLWRDWSELMRYEYLFVIARRDYIAPRSRGLASFEGGLFEADLLLFRLTDGEPLGGLRLTATNSPMLQLRATAETLADLLAEPDAYLTHDLAERVKSKFAALLASLLPETEVDLWGSHFEPIATEGAKARFEQAIRGKVLAFDRAGDVFMIRADGQGLVNLTRSPESECCADWSPDGSSIAFSRMDDNRVFVVSPDAPPRPLTPPGSEERFEGWAADGRFVHSLSNRDGGTRQPYLVDLQGNRARKLLPDHGFAREATLSRQGDRLAFLTKEGLFILDIGEDSVTRILPGDAIAGADELTWSPDGRRLALVLDDRRISIVGVDGTGLAELTDPGRGTTDGLTWSSQGDAIAYVWSWVEIAGSRLIPYSDVFVLDVESGETLNVSRSPEPDYGPDWSSDGALLAFISKRSGGREVFVVLRDGMNPTRVAEATEHGGHPDWRPDVVGD